MKKMAALLGSLLSANCAADVTDGTKYNLSGPISGFLTGREGACYVAITTSSSYYSDGYHTVDDPRMCALARAIYLLRGDIRAIAEVRYGADTNRVTDFEATSGGTPYWPPYHTADNADHYALIGPVNGYLLVAGNKSCYVSIEGNAPLSNGYHEVEDGAHCVMLLGAYLLGSTVSVSAQKGSKINLLTSVEMSESPKVHWPPYNH